MSHTGGAAGAALGASLASSIGAALGGPSGGQIGSVVGEVLEDRLLPSGGAAMGQAVAPLLPSIPSFSSSSAAPLPPNPLAPVATDHPEPLFLPGLPQPVSPEEYNDPGDPEVSTDSITCSSLLVNGIT